MAKTKEYLAPTKQKTITIDHIVAENLIQLRKDREGMSRPQFLQEIQAFGVNLSENQLWLSETTKRSFKAHELMGMAAYFDVPVAYFFWPPAVYLDRKVKIGNRTIPAHQLLLDALYPPNQDFDPFDKALHIAAEAAQEYGMIEAVKELQAAALDGRRR